jgi:hypothetical protein
MIGCDGGRLTSFHLLSAWIHTKSAICPESTEFKVLGRVEPAGLIKVRDPAAKAHPPEPRPITLTISPIAQLCGRVIVTREALSVIYAFPTLAVCEVPVTVFHVKAPVATEPGAQDEPFQRRA